MSSIKNSRRTFLRGCSGAASAPAVIAQTMALSPKRPNILYIHSHDTGRYIQPYGHNVPAPALQGLAEGGVLFRQAFSAAPTCSPSRAALLTGQYAHNAILGLVNRGFSLFDYKRHIVHTLRSAGYTSVLAGLQHVAKSKDTIGYDQVLRPQADRAEFVGPATVEFLNGRPKQPFFLDVGFSETHRPWPEPGPREDTRFTLPPATMADTPRTRLDMAAFKGSVRIMDQAVGEILRALEANGLAGNTLVIYTTDHGLPFPSMKCNLTDHGIGVSLIMRGPGLFSGGKIVDAMISHIDIFPTICDLLEIEAPAWLAGKSILPVLKGGVQESNEEIFAEVTFHGAYEPQRCVRTRRWKYIRHFDDRARTVLTNCDDSPSKTFWVEHGWRRRPVAAEQLYDLVFDPNELTNVIGVPSLGTVADEMRGRLNRWMKATDDPLLKGPVQPPEGHTLSDPNGVSQWDLLDPSRGRRAK